MKKPDQDPKKIPDLQRRKVENEAAQKSKKPADQTPEEIQTLLCEQRFQTLFELMPQGIVYQNANGEITLANPAAEHILGLSLDQMQGKTSMDPDWKSITLTGEPLPGENHPAMVALRTGKKVENFVLGVNHPDQDQTVWINVSATPQFYPGEARPYQVFVIFADITEQVKAQEILRLQDEALNAAANSILIVDKDEIVQWCNPAFCASSGYAFDEVIGAQVRELVRSDQHPPEFYQEMHETTRSGKTWRGEVINRCKDGTLIHEAVTVTPIFNAAGEYTHYIDIKEDITEQVQQRQALRENEAYIKTVMDNLPIGVAVNTVDPEVNFNYMNENFPRFYRTTKEMLSKQDAFWEAVYEDPVFRDEIRTRVLAGTASGDPEKMRWDDIPITRSGEKTTYISACNTPIEDTNLVISTVWETTERVEAEQELTHSHDLMRYIIEHNQSAVAVHDRDLKYIHVSQRYLEEYQVAEEDVIGKHLYDVFPDLPQKWRDVHQKALAGEVLFADDDPYLRADGTVEWTRWECRPWYESDGSIGGIVVYTEVTTKRKQVEEELRRLKENLEFQVEEKTTQLKERITELEQFHDATIEREFRMKELREEIKRLRALDGIGE